MSIKTFLIVGILLIILTILWDVLTFAQFRSNDLHQSGIEWFTIVTANLMGGVSAFWFIYTARQMRRDPDLWNAPR